MAPRDMRVPDYIIKLAPSPKRFLVSWSIFDRSCASFTRILLRILLCLALGASETAAEQFLNGAARKEQMNVGLGSADANYVGKLSSDKTIEKIRESEWLRIEQQRLQIRAEIGTDVNSIQVIKEKINTLQEDKEILIASLLYKRIFEAQLVKAQRSLSLKKTC
jgi:hypothetical protein